MSDNPQNQSDLQFKYESYDDDFQDSPQYMCKQDSRLFEQKKEHDGEPYDQDFTPEEKHSDKKIHPASKPRSTVGSSTDREKLIEHNIKLKTQIYLLTKQMDDILSKDKVKKRKQITQQDDENLRARKIQLKKQQLQIQQLKNKITLVKRQLQNVYDNRAIISKEDNLKSLKNELKTLQDQKAALLKIKKEQNKALRSMKSETEYESKILELRSQLAKVKDESKELGDKLVENEKILRKNHQQYIIKQSKIKEMELKLVQNKQKDKFKKVKPIISTEMIQELEMEISALEREKKDVERHWQEKISLIDQQLQYKRTEEEKKLLVLKEKERELKLNELRIKQLRKLIKHNAVGRRTNTEDQDPDPKDFRHRRNIKYMDSSK